MIDILNKLETIHDEIYGWKIDSISDFNYHYDSKPDYSDDESSGEKTDE